MEVILLGIIELIHPKISELVAVSMTELQFSRESYIILPSSIWMDDNALQSEKALSPMVITLWGMFTAAKPLHP